MHDDDKSMNNDNKSIMTNGTRLTLGISRIREDKNPY